jgi:hypothetical protein
MGNEDGDRRRQRLCREVNERIGEVAGRFAIQGPADFLCECGRPDCAALIGLTRAQWESLVNAKGCTLLAAEHADAADGRRVVADDGGFVLVADD